MTAKKAYEIIKTKYPDLVVIECMEFPEFYAFALTEKGKEDELVSGGYNTVNKTTGEMGGINPIHNFEAFSTAKEIPISTLN